MSRFDTIACAVVGTLVLAVSFSVSAARADPTTLTFEAVETSAGGAGVLSMLFRKTPETPPTPMSLDGQAATRFQLTEDTCTLDTLYTVVPIAKTLYTFPAEDWRVCKAGSSYRFEFTPNLVADGGSAVYSFFNLVSIRGATYAPLDVSQTIIMRQALQKGDLGTVSYLTTELSAAYYKAGNTAIGDQLKAVALVSGWEAVAARETTAPENPFVIDRGQLAYSTQGVDAIKAYQAKIGLVDDGKLNWKTMRSLSDLAQEDVTALGTLKADVLKPFM